MESLQNWGLLGKSCINSGLYWGSEAGNYYVNLGREGSRRAGAGLRFAEEWAAEGILDQVGSRLAAGWGLVDIKICMPTRQGIVCGRLKALRSRRRVTACTARRRGLPFAPAKGSKRVFKPNLRSPVGVAENMQGAKPVRLAAGAFLLCVQKEPKYAWGCAPRPPNA